MKKEIGENEKGMFICSGCNYEHDPAERTVIDVDGVGYSFCPKCGEESVWRDGKKHDV